MTDRLVHFGKITSNFLTHASPKLYEIRQPPTSSYNFQLPHGHHDDCGHGGHVGYGSRGKHDGHGGQDKQNCHLNLTFQETCD